MVKYNAHALFPIEAIIINFEYYNYYVPHMHPLVQYNEIYNVIIKFIPFENSVIIISYHVARSRCVCNALAMPTIIIIQTTQALLIIIYYACIWDYK